MLLAGRGSVGLILIIFSLQNNKINYSIVKIILQLKAISEVIEQ